MRRIVPFLLCCWPGLARLWLAGSGSALAEAVVFATLLNTAVVLTFIWPDLAGNELPPWFLTGVAWTLAAVLWGNGVLQTRRLFLSWQTPPPDKYSEPRFRKAQMEYLRGNWSSAERLLVELLAYRPADVEGKLLLATVLRRANRPEDALRALTQLEELPLAVYWQQEIAQERRLLAEKSEQVGAATPTSSASSSAAASMEAASTAVASSTSAALSSDSAMATAPSLPEEGSTANSLSENPSIIRMKSGQSSASSLQSPSQQGNSQETAGSRPDSSRSAGRSRSADSGDDLDIIALDRVEQERRRRAA